MLTAARRALAVVTALTVLGVLLVVFQVVRRYDPAAVSAQVEMEDSALSAEEAWMTCRLRGVTQWTVHVGRIDLRRSPEADLTEYHTAVFDGVKQGVFFSGGRARATFAADRATYERVPRRLEVAGHIELETPEGERFESEECVWTEQDEFARFPHGAKAVLNGDTLTAPEMLFSTRLRVVQCPRGAVASFRRQTVRAATLVWDVEDKRIQCSGPVTGTRGDIEFVAERAELDLRARTIHVNKGALELRMDSQ